MKSTKKEDRYKAGTRYYNKGEYDKAIRLFKSILTLYQGKPQAERIQYFIADSYYQTNQFLLAAHGFDRFVRTFPKSTRAEQAYYLSAFSHYKDSPEYSVDQEPTQKAIESFQKFINRYPNSKKVVSSDSLIRICRGKLEKKDLEIAKSYHKTRNYRASTVALRNFLYTYPDTDLREETFYYLMDSSYKLAINSIESLKKARLIEARTAYMLLLKAFPSTQYKDEVEKIKNRVTKELKFYKQES